MAVTCKFSATQLPLTSDNVRTILWESVWNALIRAFVIQILAEIAISILGDIFREMLPSAPPLGSVKPEASGSLLPGMHWLGTFVSRNEFWIIFAVVLAFNLVVRFAGYLEHDQHRRAAAALLRIQRQISVRWFRLLVINAFTAWISAAIFIFLQQFSWMQLALSLIGAAMQPAFHFLSGIVPGSGYVGRWASWYGANQEKFCFWLFYSAGICDDLGLPNYKALIRWGARRFKQYVRAKLSPAAPPGLADNVPSVSAVKATQSSRAYASHLRRR